MPMANSLPVAVDVTVITAAVVAVVDVFAFCEWWGCFVGGVCCVPGPGRIYYAAESFA